MLTSLGRFLRKLRIDRAEILNDMAKNLSVTASFLSAVENGKKKMPSGWNQKICKLYQLNKSQQEEFTQAIADCEARIEIDFSEISLERRSIAITLARNFSDFNDRQIKQLHRILKGGNE